ncbi:hypothetical protein RJ639_046827 [Escallonia herrerae]|uniref:Reverse transcriptase Ty1/copia-type domain-containing protein n=1 Tax=Escallonia herrerae TaxID=1293975 RepID=A0AA89AY16_9ASTE|nr:hypothetical protein RJ639_046827 [Escallonia herrerae]
MGGGGVMAAAKVAGIGVTHGGFRGVPEKQLAAAVRWAACSVSAIAQSAEDGKLSGGAVLAAEKVEDSVQRPCWELAGEPAPRLVFGGAPTAQEAKQVTVELKDALEKTYLSPSFTGSKGLFLSGQESGMLRKDAIQAFRLFSRSHEAQALLGRLQEPLHLRESDPSVWNVVLQNHAFVEFCELHKTSDSLLDMDKSTTETVDAADPSSPRLFDESCDTAKQSYGNWIRKILGNFRVSVVEMVRSFPGFFPNHEAKAEAETDGTFKADGAFKAYLMGLYIRANAVIVRKYRIIAFTCSDRRLALFLGAPPRDAYAEGVRNESMGGGEDRRGPQRLLQRTREPVHGSGAQGGSSGVGDSHVLRGREAERRGVQAAQKVEDSLQRPCWEIDGRELLRLFKLVEAFCRPVVLILFLLLIPDLHTSLHPPQLRDVRHLLPFSRNVGTAMSSVIRLLIAMYALADYVVRLALVTSHKTVLVTLIKWSKNPSSTSVPPKPGLQSRFKPPSHSAVAAAADDVLNNSSSSALSVNDVAKIVKQIMSNYGIPSSSSLSVTPGNSFWYFDSRCCNYMASDPFSFVSNQHLSHYPLIHTIDGSHMPVNHVGHVSTSILSLPDTYFIPSLKLNLISVGQLCDLGFDLHFSRTGCRVQDPEMGQTIGIDRKVGRLFELINLSIPYCLTIPPQSAASVTSQNSLELWHSRLGSDLDGISILKQDLNHHFKMKDLGTHGYFLGLEVSTTSDRYYLSQAKYASDIISCAGLTDSKTTSTPLEPNVRFTPLDGTPLRDPTLYRTLVGSLVYLTVTHSDIAYAVHLVSQFLSAPRTTHFAAVLYILQYIKGTLFNDLHFSSHSSLELHAYSNADWARDPTDRRSTTGFCFFLGTSLFLGEVGGEEEAGELVPRVVFGGAPTTQEAKQATVELKDALEKYVSFFVDHG